MIYSPRVGQKVVWRLLHQGRVVCRLGVIRRTARRGRPGARLLLDLEGGASVHVSNLECYTVAEALRLALQEAAGQEEK